MTSQYLELHIIDFPSDMEDLLTECLFSMGAEGVAENLPFIQEDQYLQVTMIENKFKNMVAYFAPVNPAELISSLVSRFPNIKIKEELKPNQDWLAEWKKSFVPFALTHDIWICPSWLEKPSQAKQVIYLEPGMSFGTGTHATTQLCCDLIYDFQKGHHFVEGLDVGCGTGILSIVMEMLGVQKIYAFDIDVESERVCLENREKNSSTKVIWHPDWPSLKLHPKSMVVANIIDGTLKDLRSLLVNVLPPQGILIMSGILSEREDTFIESFLGNDLELVETRQKNEWSAVVVRKKQ